MSDRYAYMTNSQIVEVVQAALNEMPIEAMPIEWSTTKETPWFPFIPPTGWDFTRYRYRVANQPGWWIIKKKGDATCNPAMYSSEKTARIARSWFPDPSMWEILKVTDTDVTKRDDRPGAI